MPEQNDIKQEIISEIEGMTQVLSKVRTDRLSRHLSSYSVCVLFTLKVRNSKKRRAMNSSIGRLT